jgi:hypothetical protein
MEYHPAPSAVPSRRTMSHPRLSSSGLPILCAFAVLAVAGCATQLIPNTDVPDTTENRRAVEFCEDYRHAMEARSPADLLQLVSDRYYDDNGTPSADDDMDYDDLRARLPEWAAQAIDVRYEIRYRRVTYRADRVLVDYTYTGSFKIRGPDDEERWERRLRDNRIELIFEGGELRILSGL